MKKTISLILLFLCFLTAEAQMMQPVKFHADIKQGNKAEARIIFTGTIASGWHVYSTELGNDGPISASFTADRLDGVKLVGKLTPYGKEINKYDNLFGMNLRYFENKVAFIQKVKFTKKKYNIVCHIEYGACSDKNCMPPSTFDFSKKGVAKVVDAAGGNVAGIGNTTIANGDSVAASLAVGQKQNSDSLLVDSSLLNKMTKAESKALWTPVVKELKALNQDETKDMTWAGIFFAGFLGGLIALFTPCVWPIIPMTVSFFLHRNKEKKKAVREAFMYGLSIVVIYVLLGLAVTLIFGAGALNSLATNAVVNILFCLLLVLFAASFFGAFEITMPSSWTNKVDSKSGSTSGLLSIFLMAFTLTLVSFSCTGPIIGFLLVAVSTSGSIVAPTIGMLGFAIALAIPFTLFAIFPSWLQSMPKSGGWMNAVKVTLGFIELAFALKFSSVADLSYGWHILDRETFLALWIAIFGLLGMYLLGRLKFKNDDDDDKIGVPRFFLGLITIAFTIYMIPGLWGAPLKAISAFSPPMNTQDFNLQKIAVEPKYKDFDIGMAASRLQNKPVMIDFTGFGCVNCRKMEASVWSDPRVAELLNNKYILISLYVDDKTPLPQPVTVTEDGQKRVLRTVGERWSYLQRSKFGANAQPFYVLLDNNGKPLNGSASYDEDVSKFIKFLQKGLDNYNKK